MTNAEQDEPLEDGNAVTAADIVCNFGSEAFVVHEEEVNFPHVANQELLEAVREKMTGLLSDQNINACPAHHIRAPYLLVATITNLQTRDMGENGYAVIVALRRTLGMGVWPLKRRRTLLSIPFGFRHASFTLL